jgi:transcriptional regulator with XRE-family HTH domain
MLRKTNGATIRALREALGISQASLAARAKLSKSYLCEVELGSYQPTMARVQRIADVLGVPLDAITYVPEPVAS